MEFVPPRTWAEVPGAVRAALSDPFVKSAEGPTGDGSIPGVKHLADVMGWRSGPINAFWGGPRPVTNLLIGAGLGSLGGYGLGRLAEAVLPERYFKPKALRRRGALFGGILGALPAAWQTYDNVRQTGAASSVFDRWPAVKASADRMWTGEAVKEAAGLFEASIDRDRFNDHVMSFGDTPLQVRAATTGLVEAASAVGRSPFVTPWDVAKVAVGAGTGLVSGIVAGKALGFLAGLSPAGREGVQRIGLWTGILNSVVPRALGLDR